MKLKLRRLLSTLLLTLLLASAPPQPARACSKHTE